MHFLPRPGGSSEDDGVLVTIVFDGPKEQVRLLHLDLELVLMLLSTVTFSRLKIWQTVAVLMIARERFG